MLSLRAMIIFLASLLFAFNSFARTRTKKTATTDTSKIEQYKTCKEIKNQKMKNLCLANNVFGADNFSCHKSLNTGRRYEEIVDCLNAYGQFTLTSNTQGVKQVYDFELNEIYQNNYNEYGDIIEYLKKHENNNTKILGYAKNLNQAFTFSTPYKASTNLKIELTKKTKARLEVDNEAYCLPDIKKAIAPNLYDRVFNNDLIKNIKKLKIMTYKTAEFLAYFHARSYGRTSPFQNQIQKIQFCLPHTDKTNKYMQFLENVAEIPSFGLYTSQDRRRFLFRSRTLYVAPNYNIEADNFDTFRSDDLIAEWNDPNLIRCEAIVTKAGTYTKGMKYLFGGKPECLEREVIAHNWKIFNPIGKKWGGAKIEILKRKKQLIEIAKSLNKSPEEMLNEMQIRMQTSKLFTDEERNLLAEKHQLDTQAKIDFVKKIYTNWKKSLRKPGMIIGSLFAGFQKASDNIFERRKINVDIREAEGFVNVLNNKIINVNVKKILSSISGNSSQQHRSDFTDAYVKGIVDHPCFSKKSKSVTTFSAQRDFRHEDDSPEGCKPMINLLASKTKGKVNVNLFDNVDITFEMPDLNLIYDLPLKNQVGVALLNRNAKGKKIPTPKVIKTLN